MKNRWRTILWLYMNSLMVSNRDPFLYLDCDTHHTTEINDFGYPQNSEIDTLKTYITTESIVSTSIAAVRLPRRPVASAHYHNRRNHQKSQVRQRALRVGDVRTWSIRRMRRSWMLSRVLTWVWVRKVMSSLSPFSPSLILTSRHDPPCRCRWSHPNASLPFRHPRM